MVRRGESKILKTKLSIKKSLESDELEAQNINVSVNDELWTCTVAMIIEKNADYKKYIKSFEDAAKVGAHSVIKNINIIELEKPVNKSKIQKKSSAKIGNKKSVSKSDNTMESSKARMTAEKILKFILQSKKEDLSAIKSRYIEINTCQSQDSISPSKIIADKEIIHNEPLCGPSLYFVLTGFYNSDVVEELLKLNIPLEVIVAFNNKPIEENEKLTNKDKQDNFEGFWSGFSEFSKAKENQELVSNLIVYQCDPKTSVIGKETLKAKDANNLIYDYTVQKLYDIQKEKRRYVHFIKSIYNVRVAEVKSIHVSNIDHYHSLVHSVPLEVVTIDHILNCLLEQIVIDDNGYDPSIKDIEEVISLEPEANDVSPPLNVEENLEFDVFAESGSSKGGLEDHESDLRETNIQKNITPFIIEHKYSRGVNMIDFQEYYLKFADYYLTILERLKCPLLWQYFPVVNRENKLLSISHYQKIREFHEKPDKVLIEACIHKRLLNKVFLGMTDSRNLDAICHDVLEGYYGCTNCDSFLCEEESKGLLEKTSDQLNVMHYDGQITDMDQYFTRDMHDFVDDKSGMEKNILADVMKTNNLILKSNKGLNELNDFLSYPELDNLFLECYNALENYTVLESFSKNTALHLLNVYSTTYDFVDYLYYTPTDSIIFVFHHGVNNDGLTNKASNYYLITPIGFRDYYNILNKIFSSWIQAQDDTIREEDETSMKKFQVMTGGEDLERCCYYNIKKFGMFPSEVSPKPKYQLHVPHPAAEPRDELEGATFIGYDMGSSSHFQSNESSTSYISNTGARVTCTNYALFNSPTIHHISFKHPSISINYDICSNLNSKQKIVVDTSDHIRIVISFISNAISALNRNGKVKSKHTEQTHLQESDEEKESEPNNIIVVLQNGLELTLYSVDNQIMGIRQRHLEPNSRSENNSEKYRIYLKDGSVMIFKNDGSIIVYYLNTTITEIKRVASEKEFMDICGTAPPINKESKAIRRSMNASTIRMSMTDGLFLKKNKTEPHNVIAEHKVLTWSGIINHYKFDFCVSSSQEHKLRTAQIPGAELYTSRSDGTKSLLNAEGELVVEYPDGTRITSTPRTHLVVNFEELEDSVEFDDRPDVDVWIYVTLGYLIEEPTNYLPVKYIGNEWSIFLPGNKGLYFSEKAKTVVTLGKLNTVLNIDFMKGSVMFGYNDVTNVFCSFFISLLGKEKEPICKFTDQEHLLKVDKQGNVNLIKCTEEEVRERSMSIFQTLHADSARYAFLSNLRSASLGQTNKSIPESLNSTEEDSFYVIKPEERQKNVKLFYLRRDLTGGEFIPDSENVRFNEETKTMNESNNSVNYSDSLCDVFLWSPYRSGQTDQYLISCKVPYSVPQCFYSSDLRRCNLSKYKSVNQVWLFEQINRSATNVTPAIRSTVLNDTQERIDSFLAKLSSRKQRHKNQSVTFIRRIIDLEKIGDSDQMLQNSLALYLDYKKKIYTAILRNALDEIKAQNKSNSDQEVGLQKNMSITTAIGFN